jgi:molybdopterin biosynthesis enzyme
MSGQKNYALSFKEGMLDKDFHKKSNRRQFVLVNVIEENGNHYLYPVKSNGSADTLSLAKSNGFMMLGENTTLAKKNTLQKFVLW